MAIIEPSPDEARSSDRFIWHPVAIAVALCSLILVPMMLGARFGFVLVPVLWFFSIVAPTLLLVAPVLLILFVFAVARLHWRRAISYALAPVAFLGVGYGMLAAMSLGTAQPAWSSVPSRSGTAIVTKTYGPADEAELYGLDLKSRWGFWWRSKQLLGLANPAGVVGEDGTIVAWIDDRHIVVGWPTGRAPVRGLTKVGDIGVAYVNYRPDPDTASAEHVKEVSLRDVTYGFEEIEVPVPRGRSLEKQCVIHLTGNDGVIYERLAVDVVGDGFGLPTDKYRGYGLMNVRFALAKMPNSNSPLSTPTQAKLGSVFPARAATSSPKQQDSSLEYRGYTLGETNDLFSLLKSGVFDVKLVLGFDKIAIVYHVAQPIDRALLKRFLACASKTNIFGLPISLPND